MKKIFIPGLLIILFLSYLWIREGSPPLRADGELPAPFQKIKEIALKTQPDSDGDYILTFRPEGRENITYLLGYMPEFDMTGIGEQVAYIASVVLWDGENQEFVQLFFWQRTLVDRKTLSKEEAVDKAFILLRELVKQNFI